MRGPAPVRTFELVVGLAEDELGGGQRRHLLGSQRRRRLGPRTVQLRSRCDIRSGTV